MPCLAEVVNRSLKADCKDINKNRFLRFYTKACVIVFPRDGSGGFKAFSHVIFCPRGRGFVTFFTMGVGDFVPSKNFTVDCQGGGMLTAGID